MSNVTPINPLHDPYRDPLGEIASRIPEHLFVGKDRGLDSIIAALEFYESEYQAMDRAYMQATKDLEVAEDCIANLEKEKEGQEDLWPEWLFSKLVTLLLGISIGWAIWSK